MNIYTNTNSPFPSQVVSDAEKASWEYGSQVAQAIEQEWFSQGRTSGNRYLTNWNNLSDYFKNVTYISDKTSSVRELTLYENIKVWRKISLSNNIPTNPSLYEAANLEKIIEFTHLLQ